jgi:hypothetical protein
MDQQTLQSADEARDYLLSVHKGQKVSDYTVTDVKIGKEQEVDGHKLWQYSLEGLPASATRNEKWIRDDKETFGIFKCLKHNIEQVVKGEVKGPNHTFEDDEN